jgi:ankyrin repeat protein
LNQHPLELAIKFNRINSFKTMLKKIKTFNFKNDYKPLIDICERDLTEFAIVYCNNELVMSNDNNIDQLSWTPLMYATVNNNHRIVAKLLECKIDVNAVNSDGDTALHLSVINDNEDIVRLLLAANGDKHIKNKDDLKPIDLAKLNDNLEMIEILK